MYRVTLVEDESGPPPTVGDVEAHIGHRVRQMRQQRGWSQRELADRMSAAGFTVWRQTTVAKTEVAERPLRVNEAVALAALFGMTIEQLAAADQHPLIVRLQNAVAVREEAAGRAQSSQWTAVNDRKLSEFTTYRLNALRLLVAFLERPTRLDLVEAVQKIMDTHSEDWQEVLVEAAIPESFIEEAENRVAENYTSDLETHLTPSDIASHRVRDPRYRGGFAEALADACEQSGWLSRLEEVSRGKHQATS